MSYQVTLEIEAINDLDQLTSVIRKRIINKIEWLSLNSEQISHIPLTGQWSNFYKLRAGDYRIIYELDREEKLITITRIGHRREIYQN